jgi:hypothetical protein
MQIMSDLLVGRFIQPFDCIFFISPVALRKVSFPGLSGNSREINLILVPGETPGSLNCSPFYLKLGHHEGTLS